MIMITNEDNGLNDIKWGVFPTESWSLYNYLGLSIRCWYNTWTLILRGVGGRWYYITWYCAHCTCVLYHVMCRQCRHHRHCTLPLYKQYRCTQTRCRHSHDDGLVAVAGLQSRQENMKQLTLNLWVESPDSWVTGAAQTAHSRPGHSKICRNCIKQRTLHCD